MSRRLRRILITALVVLVALAVLASVFFGPRNAPPIRPAPGQTASTPASTPAATQVASNEASSVQQSPSAATQPAGESSTSASAAPTTATAPASDELAGLHAQAAGSDAGARDAAPQPLGSLDPRMAPMQLVFTRQGAGIAAISFSNIWETADARRKADQYLGELSPGDPIDYSKLDEPRRYVLQTSQPYIWSSGSLLVPVLAAHSVVVNGQQIGLLDEAAWSETAPGRFESHIVNAQGEPVLRIVRQFSLGAAFDIALQQRVENVSNDPLQVGWRQYGPGDLKSDPSGYIDRKRFAFGYVPDPQRQPDVVLAGDLDLERGDVTGRFKSSLSAKSPQDRDELLTLWPNETSRSRGYELSWFASTNRYFGLAVHPPPEAVSRGVRLLTSNFNQIGIAVSRHDAPDERIFTSLQSPTRTVAPGAVADFDLGVYAGPLDRHVLFEPPLGLLSMQEMIVYRIAGGCCTFLTFQWLAKLLLGFLSLLHDYVVFDWGVAIVVLVIVVRALLHPLTKKSQISIQRFGKQMAAMKPEIDKLQKKYGSDPKRMQAEQMKLMREHGLNPFQMLGCLPMFLQMPIWIALWAMLYLAFDIRHQPAFYGIFQVFGGWSFLGDLSSPDNFWILPGGGFVIPILGVAIHSLNILPLLLGVVFYVQQKYMSPPPTPNMTPEQVQQQKIMKWMMVIMFPLLLYLTPSGLTLYIFTSTLIGVLESKRIRAHIEQMDLTPPKPREPSDKKPKDLRSRLFAEAIERAKEKRRQKSEPTRTFKKRK